MVSLVPHTAQQSGLRLDVRTVPPTACSLAQPSCALLVVKPKLLEKACISTWINDCEKQGLQCNKEPEERSGEMPGLPGVSDGLFALVDPLGRLPSG